MIKGSSAPTPRAWKRRANRCGAALWCSWQRIRRCQNKPGPAAAGPQRTCRLAGAGPVSHASARPPHVAVPAPGRLRPRSRPGSGARRRAAASPPPERSLRAALRGPAETPRPRSESPPARRVVRGASVAPRDPLRVRPGEPGARYGLARPRAGRDPRGPRRSYLRAARAPGARGRGPGLLAQRRRTSRRARPRGQAPPENRGCALRTLAVSIHTSSSNPEMCGISSALEGSSPRRSLP